MTPALVPPSINHYQPTMAWTSPILARCPGLVSLSTRPSTHIPESIKAETQRFTGLIGQAIIPLT
jgi:hypothetical protein